jgi:hypothetical protein
MIGIKLRRIASKFYSFPVYQDSFGVCRKAINTACECTRCHDVVSIEKKEKFPPSGSHAPVAGYRYATIVLAEDL